MINVIALFLLFNVETKRDIFMSDMIREQKNTTC